jgi:hypothetical protein
MTDRITDEMVEAAVSAYFESDETPWHKMRTALSAALPLMDGWIKIEGVPVQDPDREVSGYLWGDGLRVPVEGFVYQRDDGTKAGASPFAQGYTFTHWHPPLLPPPAPKGD